MQIEIIMTAHDFVQINHTLLLETGMRMYFAETYDDAIREATPENIKPDSNHAILLIGPISAGSRILGMRAIDNKRSDKVGFVCINFGGEDEYAIGITFYLADPSETAKIVTRELKKLLKSSAHLGICGVDGSDTRKNVYWTQAALDSGKNWTTFLSVGAYAYKNKTPGWRPLFQIRPN